MNGKEFELPDGRIVQQSPSGRYRDKRTGKWVSKVYVEEMRVASAWNGDQAAKQTLSPRDYVSKAMEQAARDQGYEVESMGEAWGKVMQVQAEIALDKKNTAKATAAAKMLAQATKIMEEPENDPDDQKPWFVLGRELAMEILAIIREEKTRREGED